MRLDILLMSLLFLPLSALAQWEATDQQKNHWEKYFGHFDDAARIDEIGGTYLLKPRSRCPTEQLSLNIDAYFLFSNEPGSNSVSGRQKKLAKSRLSEMRGRIKDFGSKYGKDCEEDALAHYALASFWRTLEYSSGFSSQDYSREMEAQRYKRSLGFLASALHNQRKIRWLTVENRKKLGPSWLEKKEGRFKVLGAYDCEKMVIYIDPNLRPFDVAAVLVHELDHLFRDKFLVGTGGLSLKNFLLVDETLAAVQAGYIQRDVEYMPLWIRSSDYPGTLRTDLFNTFQPPLDRTLFLPDGPVDRLWSSVEALGHDNFGPFNFDFFLSETFLRKNQGAYDKYASWYLQDYRDHFELSKEFRSNPVDLTPSPVKHLSPEQIRAPVLKTFDRLSRAYFGKTLSWPQRRLLNPEKLWLGLSPLSNWASGNSIWRQQYPSSPVAPAIGIRYFQSQHGDETELRAENRREYINSILWILDEIEKRSQKTSISCQLIQEAVSQGKLNDYIGSKIRPGSEGVKTSDSVVRPCLHFVEPP